MENRKYFYGTVRELVHKMLKEYLKEKNFTVLQISYVPSEDFTVKGPVSAQLSGYTLTLSFSGREDMQLENAKIFSDEYMNGFNGKKLRRGQVYQLTLISAYKNGSSEVKVSYPLLAGDWAQWEAYWSDNVPEADCVVYAAVNLLGGETPPKSASLKTEPSKDALYTFDIADLGELYSARRGSVQNTGDAIYPYSLNITVDLILGAVDAANNFNSFFDTDFGLDWVMVNGTLYPTVNGGDVKVMYSSSDEPHLLKDEYEATGLWVDIGSTYTIVNMVGGIVRVRHSVTFMFMQDPSGWDDGLLYDLYRAEENELGARYIKLGVRINVPEHISAAIKGG